MAIEIVFNPLEQWNIEHVLLDFNGTMAFDGKLIPGVAELIKALSEHANVHVISADTYKTVAEELSNLPLKLTIIKSGQEKQQKLFYLENLGRDKCIAIGNGVNDVLMLSKAAVGIAVVQSEGCASEAMQAAKILCPTIHDALTLCLKPKRIVATLRK